MSLKNLLTDLVSDAFDILDDLPRSGTYVQQTVGEYDTDTGSVVHTEVTHLIPKCVYTAFTQREKEKDENINGTTDQKMLFPLKGHTFIINDNDVIEDDNGVRWDIKKSLGVPGDSVGILWLRER